MKKRGRPILGAISGLLFGLFVGLELVFFKVVPMGTLTTMVLPLAGLVVGVLMGISAPFGRSSPETTSPEPAVPEP